MNFTVLVSGDSIISRRISVCQEERFLALIKLVREADVAYTHLETNLVNYDGSEVYPAAEAGWTWMRSPLFVAEELKWAGFNIVSNASNHSLDYAYGGLKSTWKALNAVGLPYAGTGRNLGEAREPAYLDTAKGRVALISMTSSFPGWARAGEARTDMKGRPGVNPLRYYYKVDAVTLQAIKELALKMGWWVTQVGKEWLLNPPGLHNTIYRFVEWDGQGVTTVANDDDVEGNIKSIKEARRQADLVIVHMHNHEWDPQAGLSVPGKFVPPFARACIDAGADLFIAEGSHSFLRGLEIYQGKPIFYDPGDLFRTGETITRLPADYYWRPGYHAQVRKWEATTSDAFAARKASPPALNPPGGYQTARVLGIVVPVCTFGEGMKLTGIKLYPATFLQGSRAHRGLPGLAAGQQAQEIITYLGELSSPWGTEVEFVDGIGFVKLAV